MKDISTASTLSPPSLAPAQEGSTSSTPAAGRRLAARRRLRRATTGEGAGDRPQLPPHAQEAGNADPDGADLLPEGDEQAFSGPNDDVIIPRGSEKTDYEVELAIVIGTKTAKYVDVKDAKNYIAGYCVVTTTSPSASTRSGARLGQWTKGKSCDTFCPMGPWIVTADETGDPEQAGRSATEVNGESGARTATPPISFSGSRRSSALTWQPVHDALNPGDVIPTGLRREGVAMGFSSRRNSSGAGDVMRIGVEGLGASRTTEPRHLWQRADEGAEGSGGARRGAMSHQAPLGSQPAGTVGTGAGRAPYGGLGVQHDHQTRHVPPEVPQHFNRRRAPDGAVARRDRRRTSFTPPKKRRAEPALGSTRPRRAASPSGPCPRTRNARTRCRLALGRGLTRMRGAATVNPAAGLDAAANLYTGSTGGPPGGGRRGMVEPDRYPSREDGVAGRPGRRPAEIDIAPPSMPIRGWARSSARCFGNGGAWTSGKRKREPSLLFAGAKSRPH